MIVVELPRLLAQLAGGRRRVEVVGTTVGEALAAVAVELPALRVHLLDEAGEVRRHVSVFHNDVILVGSQRREVAVADGDVLLVTQAASGG